MPGSQSRKSSGNSNVSWLSSLRSSVWLLLRGPLFLVGVMVSSVTSGEQQAAQLVFVVSNDAGIYCELRLKILSFVSAGMGNDVSAAVVDISKRVSAEPQVAINEQQTTVVTIGTDAARYAYTYLRGQRIISTLITYDGFQNNVTQLYGSEQAALQAGVSAVLLEQPIWRYFELGATLVPAAKKVGVLLGPASSRHAAEIDNIAKTYDVEVELVKLRAADNPIQGIQPVLKNADYFVVLPDQQAFNRAVARWVLQLSYRYRVPVIAYSKRYAEAGAIASVYSSVEDIALETSRLLLTQKKYPAPAGAVRLAADFSVQTNRSVASAIGIALPAGLGMPAESAPGMTGRLSNE